MALKQQRSRQAQWMQDAQFNLLVDYYPDVTFRPYGSGATRDDVLKALKLLQPGYLIVYAKGHGGYTTFPSRLKTEHPMLAKDMPAFFREITRETGVRLILYYSGLVDGVAGTRHPGWRMRSHANEPTRAFDGLTTLAPFHNICPQSSYFDKWVRVHLEEMIGRYDPDGIWVDGDWPGLCYCEKCRRRYRNNTGFKGMPPYIHLWTGPLPTAEGLSPETVAWMKTWSHITHEWRMRFNHYVKELKPSCLYSAGNVSSRSEFLEPFDWRSGDWFSPKHHRLAMSFAMRRYSTMGIPCDGFTCDTGFVHELPALRSRSKSLDRMLQEGATLMANGGKWGYWTYPMPDGAFIPSKMKMASKAAAFARKRAAVTMKTAPVKWTAVLYTEPSSNTEFVADGAAKALVALHRAPLLIDERQLEGNLPYELIVVPDRAVFTQETASILERFVRKGGKIIGTGMTALSPHWQKLAGIRLAKREAFTDGHVLLRNGSFTGLFAPWDRVTMTDAKEFYPHFLSWDQFNPELRGFNPNYPINGMVDENNPECSGIPAATFRALGKGAVIHIPSTPFALYAKYGFPDILAWIREMLERIQPRPLLTATAPSCVEISLRTRDRDLLVHFINGNPGRDLSHVHTQDLWVDEIPKVGPFECRIRSSRPGKAPTWEPGGRQLSFKYRNRGLTVRVPRFHIHGCIVLQGWKP